MKKQLNITSIAPSGPVIFLTHMFEVGEPKTLPLLIFICLRIEELDRDPLILHSTDPFSSLSFHHPYIYQPLPYSEENCNVKVAHFS